MKNSLIPILSILLIVCPAYAVEKASEKRLDEVAERGVHVMPFDLDLTTHIFSKSEKGGLQQIIAKDSSNMHQIQLIREHLTEISDEFQKGDFSKPVKIHDESMPGIKELRKAKPNQISIIYKDLRDGAEINYSADNPVLINAIHKWFDAQLSDHARHAISGHSHHEMHNK